MERQEKDLLLRRKMIFLCRRKCQQKKVHGTLYARTKRKIFHSKNRKKVIIIQNLVTVVKTGGGGGEKTHKILNGKKFDFFSFLVRA